MDDNAITGIAIDSPRSPTVRRKMPAPFTRPSISIGGSSCQHREWRTVAVTDLVEGDCIPGLGRVFQVDEKMDLGTREWTVTVRGGVDNVRVYQGNESVWAFAAARS